MRHAARQLPSWLIFDVGQDMNLADQSSKTLATVVPRIYVNLPKGVPADVTLAHEDSPVDRPLIADLVVMYAFDVGAHYEIVAHRDLSRLGVSKVELHDRALQNLRAMNLEIQAHQGDRILMLTAGDNYEATLLLLPEVWASVAQMVSGQIVVSVPARDVLYVTGDAIPENLADLRQWTSKMLEQADKPLSRVFLRWSGWSIQATHPEMRKRPNKAPEPTPGLVTPRALESALEMNRRNGNRDSARGAPSPVVAHL